MTARALHDVGATMMAFYVIMYSTPLPPPQHETASPRLPFFWDMRSSPRAFRCWAS